MQLYTFSSKEINEETMLFVYDVGSVDFPNPPISRLEPFNE